MNAKAVISRNRTRIEEQSRVGVFNLEHFTAWFMRTFDEDLDEYSKDNFGQVSEQLKPIWEAGDFKRLSRN
jgi:hypothetical protein